MKTLTEQERIILFDKYKRVVTNDQEDIDKNERTECCICINEFCKDDEVLIHPLCKHIYHMDCVQDWFKNKMICPMCKQQTRTAMIRTMSLPGNDIASIKNQNLFEEFKENERVIDGFYDGEEGEDNRLAGN